MKYEAAYDALAWVYNKHWGPRYARQVLPVLEKLVLRRLSQNAHILDLCCGSGQLACALNERGFAVTGLDVSEQMIRIARGNAPGARFAVEDARSFQFQGIYDSAISVFDSLNQIMALEDLTTVFRNVYRALRDGGLWLFDMNLEEGYKARWHGSYNIVEDDHVCLVRLGYRSEEKLGESQLTIFRLEDEWRRSDVALEQRCYSEKEILLALESRVSRYKAI